MAHDIKAVALAGGGGLGAYQAGVMKALVQRDMLKDIQCFSGTSVGALNAVLWSIGDAELSEYVWKKWVDPVGMLGKLERSQSGFHPSRETLRAILRNTGVTRIRHTAPVYACAYDIKAGRAEYFYLNDKPESEMTDILLASSAISVIYEPVSIGGRLYKDGSSSFTSPLDNYPVGILYEKGYRDILLVPLRSDFDGSDVRSWHSPARADMYSNFPDAKISVLKPSCGIGGAGGIVDFSPDSINMRIAVGFYDGYNFGGRQDEPVPPEGHHDKVIRSLAEKYLRTSADMESFIALRKNKYVTAVNPTLGGRMWYKDIFELDGFRIQWHCKVPVVGRIMENHYRILGRDDELRAYYFDPAHFIEDLTIFGEQKNKGMIK
ncbi:MAG: patatin-like phospholipase family protein [Oscillospiraceae bacterium]|nr:patatin-like phospholipase family protein [Oscillospiraceae bacterium]